MVKTLSSNARGVDLIPGQGAKILYVSCPKEEKKNEPEAIL